MKKMTTEEFIEKAFKVHGNKYVYSKVVYINSTTKVCIICPEHGEFWQRPADHLQGSGCSRCKGVNKSTTEEFIKKANIIRPEYDYSKVDYINSKSKVCIICPGHGEFFIRPNDLLNGYGCRKCAGNNIKKTTKEFIRESINIHGSNFDYSLVEYSSARCKVKIICHKKDKNGKEHGIFLQEPLNHINGAGCPRCNSGNKSKFEEKIGLYLESLNVNIIRQKTFDWLVYKKHLFLDFYLPQYNTCIEVQGEQHYQPIQRFGGYEDYIIRQQRDIVKRELCEKHNINIIYIRKNDDYKAKIKQIIDGKATTNKESN